MSFSMLCFMIFLMVCNCEMNYFNVMISVDNSTSDIDEFDMVIENINDYYDRQNEKLELNDVDLRFNVFSVEIIDGYHNTDPKNIINNLEIEFFNKMSQNNFGIAPINPLKTSNVSDYNNPHNIQIVHHIVADFIVDNKKEMGEYEYFENLAASYYVYDNYFFNKSDFYSIILISLFKRKNNVIYGNFEVQYDYDPYIENILKYRNPSNIKNDFIENDGFRFAYSWILILICLIGCLAAQHNVLFIIDPIFSSDDIEEYKRETKTVFQEELGVTLNIEICHLELNIIPPVINGLNYLFAINDRIVFHYCDNKISHKYVYFTSSVLFSTSDNKYASGLGSQNGKISAIRKLSIKNQKITETILHELGHNFGIKHDNRVNCPGEYTNCRFEYCGQHIMGSMVSRKFSSCSKRQFLFKIDID